MSYKINLLSWNLPAIYIDSNVTSNSKPSYFNQEN